MYNESCTMNDVQEVAVSSLKIELNPTITNLGTPFLSVICFLSFFIHLFVLF